MYSYAIKPCLTVSPWVKDLLQVSVEDIIEYTSPADDIGQIAITIDLSEDADKIMSAFTQMQFLRTHDTNSEYDEAINCIVNSVQTSRWEFLLNVRLDIARECIRWMVELDTQPNLALMEVIAHVTEHDTTAAEILYDVWLSRSWTISLDLIYAIRFSNLGYLIMFYDIPTNLQKSSDHILSYLFNDDSFSLEQKVCFNAILGTDSFALEYLIRIDEMYGDGIAETIKTINKHDLWIVVLPNPASKPIVAYSLKNFKVVRNGLFKSTQQLRRWILPQIATCPYAAEIVRKSEYKSMSIDFFANSYCIDNIKSWMTKSKCNDRVVAGLIVIASSNQQTEATFALSLLKTCLSWRSNCLDITDWESLLESKYGSDFVFDHFKNDKKELISIMRLCDLLPCWIATDYGAYEVFNLTKSTAKRIQYDPELSQQMSIYVNYLGYSEWSILMTCSYGMNLAMHNIQSVVNEGALHILLESACVTPEYITDLFKVFDYATDYSTDEDVLAIINRMDAFDVDRHQVYKTTADLMRELVMHWHCPSRLVSFTDLLNIDLRSYLALL